MQQCKNIGLKSTINTKAKKVLNEIHHELTYQTNSYTRKTYRAGAEQIPSTTERSRTQNVESRFFLRPQKHTKRKYVDHYQNSNITVLKTVHKFMQESLMLI